jgi:hypothetical protein
MQCGIYKIAIKDDRTLIQNVFICLIGSNYIICIRNSAPKIFQFPCATNLKTVKDYDDLEEVFDRVNYSGAFDNLVDEIAGTGPAFLMYLAMMNSDEVDPGCFPREINVGKIRRGMIDRSVFTRDAEERLEESEPEQRPKKRARQE